MIFYLEGTIRLLEEALFGRGDFFFLIFREGELMFSGDFVGGDFLFLLQGFRLGREDRKLSVIPIFRGDRFWNIFAC